MLHIEGGNVRKHASGNVRQVCQALVGELGGGVSFQLVLDTFAVGMQDCARRMQQAPTHLLSMRAAVHSRAAAGADTRGSSTLDNLAIAVQPSAPSSSFGHSGSTTAAVMSRRGRLLEVA